MATLKVGDLVHERFPGTFNGGAFISCRRGDKVRIRGQNRFPTVPGGHRHHYIGYWRPAHAFCFVWHLDNSGIDVWNEMPLLSAVAVANLPD